MSPFVKVFPLTPGATLPSRQSPQAAGADLAACLPAPAPILPNGGTLLVPLGFSVEIPVGYEIQIRPRSGLALKHRVTVLNTPGTIDADYRGEVMVLLINHGTETFYVNPGDRIAQAVLAPVARGLYDWADYLVETERGDAGFGSTGV